MPFQFTLKKAWMGPGISPVRLYIIQDLLRLDLFYACLYSRISEAKFLSQKEI
jgi:hypothetical protein